MDPNLPPQTQPPTDPTSSPNISGRKNIIIISILVVAGLLLGSIFYINSKKSSPKPVQVEKPAFTPTPTPVRTTSLKNQTHIGILTSITNNNLTIKPEATGSANITFSISENLDIEKLISGTIENMGVKLEKARHSDLKEGQRVYIITNNIPEAITVIIW